MLNFKNKTSKITSVFNRMLTSLRMILRESSVLQSCCCCCCCCFFFFWIVQFLGGFSSATTLMVLTLLSANHTKCPNTIKQFVGYYPTNFLIVFDHFLGLTLEGIVLKTLHLLVRLKLRSIDHIYCGIYWKEYKE